MTEPTTAGASSPVVAASPEEQSLFREKLRYLVRGDCPTFPSSTPTREVLARMRELGAAGVLLTEDRSPHRLAGIFTERDYLDKLHHESALRERPISEFMTPDPQTLSPDDTVGDAIRLMTEGGYRHLPIQESDGEILGLVSCGQLVVYISEHYPQAVINQPPEFNQHPSTPEGG